ncbi:MAG: hypothetical protein MJ078_08390, partial [Clostridia bacterium]|nr:hypothetical protein [Clostridia bacterium]
QNNSRRAVRSERAAFRSAEAVDTCVSRSQNEWEEAEAAAAKGKNIPLRIVVSCVLAVALGSGVALILRRNMNTVRFQRDAVAYQTGNLKITKSKDVFLYSHVSRIRVSSDDTSRSSSRTSGGGRTTGGRF